MKVYIIYYKYEHCFIIIEMVHYPNEIEYSDKYYDEVFEYKHVALPKDIYEKIPKGRLLNESEWRVIGISQTRGWVHYAIYKPEPHILMFKRPIGSDPKTGEVSSDVLHRIAVYQKKNFL